MLSKLWRHKLKLTLGFLSSPFPTWSKKSGQKFKYINPYSPNVTFLHPLKTSENRRFSDIFRGYRNVTLREYGLRMKKAFHHFKTFTEANKNKSFARWESDFKKKNTYPAKMYLLKVKNRKTTRRCKICSKLTIKAPKQGQWRCFRVFILLTLNIFHTQSEKFFSCASNDVLSLRKCADNFRILIA